MRTLPYVPASEANGEPKRGVGRRRKRLGPRTFTYDLPKGVIPDDSDLLRGELLAQLVVCVRELCLMVLRLRDGTGGPMSVAACGHSDMYREGNERRKWAVREDSLQSR